MATVVFGDYEWDSVKAATNLETHQVSFAEAATALQDPHAAYLNASPAAEERLAAIGFSVGARLLFVVLVERGERDRIVSAPAATPAEEAIYADR